MSYDLAKIRACRFDYEYLGLTTDILAKKYDFPIADIEAEISQEAWEHKLSPIKQLDSEQVAELAVDLRLWSKSQLTVMAHYRQLENQPLLAEIERVLLVKILEIASNLDTSEVKCSYNMLNLVKAFNEVQSKLPVELKDTVEQGGVDDIAPTPVINFTLHNDSVE